MWRYASLCACICIGYGRYWKVFVLRYLQILRTYRHAGIKYLHCKFCARNTYCCICHYPPVFWSRYLHIPTAICGSLELQLPVVPPTRCTRTEEVEPQQRALVDAMMMTQVEVVVERLWLDDPAEVMRGAHRPMRSKELKHCTAPKTQTIKPWYEALCTIPQQWTWMKESVVNR